MGPQPHVAIIELNAAPIAVKAEAGSNIANLPVTGILNALQGPALSSAGKAARLNADASAILGLGTVRLQSIALIDEVVDLAVVRGDIDGFGRLLRRRDGCNRSEHGEYDQSACGIHGYLPPDSSQHSLSDRP